MPMFLLGKDIVKLQITDCYTALELVLFSVNTTAKKKKKPTKVQLIAIIRPT